MTDHAAIEQTAFDALTAIGSAEFDLLMSYKFGDADALMHARRKFAAIVAHIDACEEASRISRANTERHVREMNAELPDDVREVMQLKGMI
jgi:hypothetical protein